MNDNNEQHAYHDQTPTLEKVHPMHVPLAEIVNMAKNSAQDNLADFENPEDKANHVLTVLEPLQKLSHALDTDSQLHGLTAVKFFSNEDFKSLRNKHPHIISQIRGSFQKYVDDFNVEEISEGHKKQVEEIKFLGADQLTQLGRREFVMLQLKKYAPLLEKFLNQGDQRSITELPIWMQGGANLLLDLDNFKKINDTYGHDVGDVVLQLLANSILNTFRGTDLISVIQNSSDELVEEGDNPQANKTRMGGEEFQISLGLNNIDSLDFSIPESQQQWQIITEHLLQKDLLTQRQYSMILDEIHSGKLKSGSKTLIKIAIIKKKYLDLSEEFTRLQLESMSSGELQKVENYQPITFSCGVAMYEPKDVLDLAKTGKFKDFYSKADKVLYAAKHAGKSQCHFDTIESFVVPSIKYVPKNTTPKSE